MKYVHYVIVIAAILVAAWFTFQLELFSHEFRMDFLFRGDWISLIMLMILVIAIGGIFKLLAGMTAHEKKGSKK